MLSFHFFVSAVYGMNAFTSVVVGVADLEQALALWRGEFGLTVVARKEGDDPELTRLWKLEPGDIRRQALLATPGCRFGMVHFVEFHEPERPVRAGAASTDCCPKNLDVYADDLPGKVQQLVGRGRRFRNPDYSEVTAPSGVRFREAHMPAHDDINVVLLEVLGQDTPYSTQGYAAVGLLIAIVPDAGREKRFLREALGLDLLAENLLQGPEVEKMIGLPSGAALDASIWGQTDNPLGQIEIIEYRGAAGANLYPRARPKALGILHASFAARDLGAVRHQLGEQNIAIVEHGYVATLALQGDTISIQSPAGMRIELCESLP